MVTSTRRKLQGPPPLHTLPPRARGTVVTRLVLRHCTRGALALILLGAGGLFGCAGGNIGTEGTEGANPGGARTAQGTPDAGSLRGRAEWTGDTPPPWPVVHASWRDILSGVHWASSRNGFAVLEVVDRDIAARDFHLLGIRGERGVVRVRASRTVENSLPSDPWITFEITLGALGEDERRHALRADLLAFRPSHAR